MQNENKFFLVIIQEVKETKFINFSLKKKNNNHFF